MVSSDNGTNVRCSYRKGFARLSRSVTRLSLIQSKDNQNFQSPRVCFSAVFCEKNFFQSPSFPNVSIGNPGETGTGPPIKTFGGDAFGINSHRYLLIPRQLTAGSSVAAPGMNRLRAD